jgi:soluble epoxide hydrolase/lipid-phosphate phosphatase
MAPEILAILDKEGIEKTHGIGHDFGSHLLSRLANYAPERFLSLVFLVIPYMPSGMVMDQDRVNVTTKGLLSFERFGYWRFYERNDAAEIIKEHVR